MRRYPLEPLDYKGVVLEASRAREVLEQTKTFYLNLANDDLLRGFRARAGKPAPGKDLGGWYGSDTFHVFGQLLSGLARLYAATGDSACKTKLDALIAGWGACIAPDGYFFFSNKPNAPHYTYEKLVGGLVDAQVYTNNPQAKLLLRRITEWAEKNLDRKRPYGADPNEWYTLSENLYRAYSATGEVRYREFAKIWEYTDYWGAYARKQDIHARAPGYHAYSHVNTLSGAAQAYIVTGAPEYLATLRNAFDYLQAAQCFATGGYGPDESLLPRAERRRHVLDTHATFETQCGAWAGFKLTKYLTRFTGEARYGDWVEKLLWNGLIASVPNAADGRVFYYADYNPSGAIKTLFGAPFPCCAGTRPMAVADICDQLVYESSDGLSLSQYVPATIRWRNATIHVQTRFPESDEVTIGLELDSPTTFAIRLRAPGWLAKPATATLNGQAIPLKKDPLGWWVIKRAWKTGDRLQLRLPMGFRWEHLDPDQPWPAALCYGPLALTVRSEKTVIPEINRMVPSRGEPLTWHTNNAPEALVRPFHLIPEGEPYRLYLDPSAARRIHYRQVRFTGDWADSGAFRFSNQPGATAELTFEGTGIRWLGQRFDDAGIAEISIDGKVIERVNQLGPGRGLPFDWRITNLSPGKHTIRLTLLPEKLEGSKDRFLNVAGFELL
ncbi:MAG: glycoside hydrolase family 127 protein [Armatimonas sp.]